MDLSLIFVSGPLVWLKVNGFLDLFSLFLEVVDMVRVEEASSESVYLDLK